MRPLTKAALAFLLRLVTSDAHYFEGVNPRSFMQSDVVQLKVNKMTSMTTQMPLDFYELPFCMPHGGPVVDNENLGEFLAGDRIKSSPYLLRMKDDMYCEHLCISNLGRNETEGMMPNRVVRAIRKNYHNNWIVDNLSAASKEEDDYMTTTRYWQGFPIGYVAEDTQKAYIHNHLNIEIMYHKVDDEPSKYRVVRFTVVPFSIFHDFESFTTDDNNDGDDDDGTYLPRLAKIKNPIASGRAHTTYKMVTASNQTHQFASGKVLFTYDVIWSENNETDWASRWDIYLSMDEAVPDKVHWLSIFNSLVIVFVLSAMIAAILIPNVRRDIVRYNRLATDEENHDELEEYGWKLVHADVFRPPSFSPLLLSVSCGTGAQLLCTTFLTIVFSALGYLNPARRGHQLMMDLFLFVVMSGVAGYVTARLYKTFKGEMWQRATLYTALGFPGIAFVLFALINVVALSQHSTYAVPFGTLLVLIFLWFGVSLPLVYIGAYFGYRCDAIEFPVNTSSNPRQIPCQQWFMGIPFTLLFAGILLSNCFVELFYIMASLWMGFYYYAFGFLLLVFLILMVTCAEITVLFTYLQLRRENYHWWWRSFINAGSTAIYVALYSCVFFMQLDADSLAAYILYFGYMGLVCIGLFVMMGFVGVSSSLWFNMKIFASIKID